MIHGPSEYCGIVDTNLIPSFLAFLSKIFRLKIYLFSGKWLMRNNSFLVECVIGIVSVQQSSPLIKRSFPDSRSMSGSSTWTMVQPSMSGMGDDWGRSMSQLNSKAFSWLTAASLQASVFLGGVALAPSAVAQSKVTTPLTKPDLATYSTMSLLTFCQARDLDVGFETSLRIALVA